jgi:hypothetical protein
MYLPGIGQKTPPKTNKTKPDPDSADDPEASADECALHRRTFEACAKSP